MLKKFAFATLGSLGALALAGAAQADNSPSFALTANVAPVCEVSAAGNTFTVDLTRTSGQSAGDLTYKCNAQNGFSVKFSSQNGGVLKNGNQTIVWNGQQGGNHGLNIGPAQLTAPYTLNVGPDVSFLTGVAAPITISLPTVPTALYAGTYSDVVTVAVTAK